MKTNPVWHEGSFYRGSSETDLGNTVLVDGFGAYYFSREIVLLTNDYELSQRLNTDANMPGLDLCVASITDNVDALALQVGVDSRVDDIYQVGVDIGGTDRGDVTSLDCFYYSIREFR